MELLLLPRDSKGKQCAMLSVSSFSPSPDFSLAWRDSDGSLEGFVYSTTTEKSFVLSRACDQFFYSRRSFSDAVKKYQLKESSGGLGYCKRGWKQSSVLVMGFSCPHD
jgi:hypothetical protein